MLNFVILNKRQILGRYLTFFVLGLNCLLWGCRKGPEIFRSYGTDAEKTIALKDITKLRVGQKFKLMVTSDTAKPEQITVKYGSNLLEGIVAEESDGWISLLDKNRFNWVRDMDVQPLCTLNVHRLNALDIQGAAAVTFLDTVYTNQVDVVMNSVEDQLLLFHCGNLYGNGVNTGHTVLAGQGTIFAWGCENGGSFDAEKLRCDDAYIYHYAARDVVVNPKNIFYATVYGTGNIYYLSEPMNKFEKKEFGKGKVLKK